MGGSEAYARIKRDVYRVAAAVPSGRVTTYAAIGRFLDVVPRQVAYLLALRGDADRETVPWHRVVGDDGALGRPKVDFHGRSQAALLAAEGVPMRDATTVALTPRLLFTPTTRNTGVTPVPRAAATGAAATTRSSTTPAPSRSGSSRPRRSR